PTAFGRRHAGVFHGPGPLGRGPAAVEGVVDTVVVQGVLGIEQSGVVLNVGRVRLVDVVSPSVGAVHGYLQGVGPGRPRSRRGPHRTALVRDTGATRPRPPGTRVFPEPVPDASHPPPLGTAQRHGTPPPPARPAPAATGTTRPRPPGPRVYPEPVPDSALPPRFGTAQRHGTPPPPARPAPAGTGRDHRPRQEAAGPGPRGRGAKGVRSSPGAAPPWGRGLRPDAAPSALPSARDTGPGAASSPTPRVSRARTATGPRTRRPPRPARRGCRAQ